MITLKIVGSGYGYDRVGGKASGVMPLGVILYFEHTGSVAECCEALRAFITNPQYDYNGHAVRQNGWHDPMITVDGLRFGGGCGHVALPEVDGIQKLLELDYEDRQVTPDEAWDSLGMAKIYCRQQGGIFVHWREFYFQERQKSDFSEVEAVSPHGYFCR